MLVGGGGTRTKEVRMVGRGFLFTKNDFLLVCFF
jgi:hypothetical protein